MSFGAKKPVTGLLTEWPHGSIMSETAYLTRATLAGGAVGLLAGLVLWPGWPLGAALTGALAAVAGPQAGLMLLAGPPALAGGVAGSYSTFEAQAEVATDGALAGGVTGLGLLALALVSSLSGVVARFVAGLGSVLADPGAVGSVLSSAGATLVTAALVAALSAAIAAVPGLTGGLLAYRLRSYTGPGDSG